MNRAASIAFCVSFAFLIVVVPMTALASESGNVMTVVSGSVVKEKEGGGALVFEMDGPVAADLRLMVFQRENPGLTGSLGDTEVDSYKEYLKEAFVNVTIGVYRIVTVQEVADQGLTGSETSSQEQIVLSIVFKAEDAGTEGSPLNPEIYALMWTAAMPQNALDCSFEHYLSVVYIASGGVGITGGSGEAINVGFIYVQYINYRASYDNYTAYTEDNASFTGTSGCLVFAIAPLGVGAFGSALVMVANRRRRMGKEE